jgi:hypothetical protein
VEFLLSDRQADFYRMMDQAGLNGTDILVPRKPIQQIINSIRTSLALQLKDYVEQIEKEYEHEQTGV